MLLYILCHIISIILYHVHISILYQLYRLCQYIISIITIILIIPIIFLTLVVSCFSGVILVGGGGQDGGYDALDYRKIKNGNAGPLGNYAILSVLPDKFARFLFEYHSCRFETLDLPTIPDDRSQFDVHGALEDDKVKQLEST